MVDNVGGAATQGAVTVTDDLPTGLSAVKATGDGWTCDVSAGAVSCTRPDALAAGAKYPTITVTTNVAADAPATVANSATVSGGGDGDPTNNVGTDTSAPARQTDLALTKTADVSSVAVGGTVTYALKATNNGSSASTGAVVTDALPAGLTFVSADNGCTGAPGSTTVTCKVGALASGASATFSVVAKAAIGTAGTTLRNTAAVTANETDPTPGNDAADASVAVKPVDLVVTNGIDGAPAALEAGSTYTWKVGVKNVGGSPATGSTVSFPVPAGTTVVTAGLDPAAPW